MNPAEVQAQDEEVRYDLQVLGSGIENFWMCPLSDGAVHDSIWAFDGKSMRVWLDPLAAPDQHFDIPLDFYPLVILSSKGLISGISSTGNSKSMMRADHVSATPTSTASFVPQLLRHVLLHLARHDMALALGATYQSLSYWSYALEVLLHDTLETSSPPDPNELSQTIEFLDHFDSALDVIASCARKSEMERWEPLFAVAGPPSELFDSCLSRGDLRAAAKYLLIMHTMGDGEYKDQTLKLLGIAHDAKDFKVRHRARRRMGPIG